MYQQVALHQHQHMVHLIVQVEALVQTLLGRRRRHLHVVQALVLVVQTLLGHRHRQHTEHIRTLVNPMKVR